MSGTDRAKGIMRYIRRQMRSAATVSDGGTEGKSARKTASMTPIPPGVCDSKPAENDNMKAPRTTRKPGFPVSGSTK